MRLVISDHLVVPMEEMKIESDSANDDGGCGLIREFRVRFKDAFSIIKQNLLVCRLPTAEPLCHLVICWKPSRSGVRPAFTRISSADRFRMAFAGEPSKENGQIMRFDQQAN